MERHARCGQVLAAPAEAAGLAQVSSPPRALTTERGPKIRSASEGCASYFRSGQPRRPRYVAVYLVDGAYAAREVKARAPSAWHWANDDGAAPARDPLPRIWQRAIRSQDPFLAATTHWLARRLAPDCSRIDLASVPQRRHEAALLSVMGWEVANVHLGSVIARPLQENLDALRKNWLSEAVEVMLDATSRDYGEWSRRPRKNDKQDAKRG